jgi:endonuclease/exonuclease/phosphatase (EEP) superfamily protein YafD
VTPSFTLVTCNLLFECREPQRMIASLKEADPDILLLLEFSGEWQRQFKETLWKDYPHRLEEPQPGPFGICLASKLPLANAAVDTVAGDYPVVRAAVEFQGRRIGLLGVHPLPPIRPAGYDVWRQSFSEWRTALRDTNAPHRILAGDLNCTPFTRAFSRLCQETGLRDSARGFSLTNTWHLAGPFGLPLDHVLVSSGLSVLDYRIGPEAGSDHRWVMVRIVCGGLSFSTPS